MRKIIFADGHPIVRQGLRSLLAKDGAYQIVGEADSFPELKSRLSTEPADLLILELSMPGGSGLEALKEIKRGNAELAVLILSFHPEDHFGLRAFKSGASGYLSKDSAPEELLEALRTITTGKRYFGKVTEESIFNELNHAGDSGQDRHRLLSDRELHVFMQIGEGKTLTEISRDLALSIKTVSTYRQRILKKMDKTTNIQIVRYCALHCLVESSA